MRRCFLAMLFLALFAVGVPALADSPGTTANRQGRMLENIIRHTLEAKGLETVGYAAWKRDQAAFGGELLITNAPFTTIYGHRGRTEFLLVSERHDLRIRIEAKWQQVGGSTDEKLAYLYLNAIEAMPEPHVIIVIDGGGWRPQAVEWLRHAAQSKAYTGPGNHNKTVDVMSLSQFIAWVNRTFR